jgi:hypothetical protein
MCACVCARSCDMPMRTVCVCIDACASRNVRTPRCAHTHTSAALSAFVCSHLLVHARTCGYINTCAYRWLGMDRCASVCIERYLYPYYIFGMYSQVCTYACTWVCTDTLRTQVSICACTQTDATRARGFNRHPFIYIYMSVYGHLSKFRHMYFGAASRRACGRAFAAAAPAWAASALAYNHRSECTGVSITRLRVCVCACVTSFAWLRPFRPHGCPSVRGGRGPHARAVLYGRFISGTRVTALPESLGQCKLLEYLCVPRPPPRCARSRRCRRVRCCRVRCRAGRWAAPRGVGCGGNGVAGRRPQPSPAHACLAPSADRRAFAVGRSRPARPHWSRAGTRKKASSRRCRSSAAWRARPTGARSGWAGAARRSRTVGAQGRDQYRARGAAGGCRVAEPGVPVSAPAAALTRPRRCADAWRAGERRAH